MTQEQYHVNYANVFTSINNNLSRIADELRDARTNKACLYSEERKALRATINSYFSAQDLRDMADAIEDEWKQCQEK